MQSAAQRILVHNRAFFAVLFAIVYTLGLPTTFAIADADEITDEMCLNCHGDAGSVGDEAYVDSAKLAKGPHHPDNGVTCVGCHTKAVTVEDIEDHGELGAVSCSGECHDIAEEIAQGAHGWDPREDRRRPQCADCHGKPHAILYVADKASPAHRSNELTTCEQCHSGKVIDSFKNDVHANLPLDKRAKGAVCSSCHGAHKIPNADILHNAKFKQELARHCGECHEDEWKSYSESIHGVALLQNHRTGSASCADCHGSHGILPPTDPDSKTHPSHVSETCAGCHQDARLIRRFNLRSNVVESYRESFHGRVTRLSDNTQAANCSSCHSYHDVFPASDSRSTVHPDKLRDSCGHCHPGASENFLKGSIHVSEEGSENKWASMVRVLYIWLILFSVGGMLAHNMLDFIRKMRIRRARHKHEPFVVRMSKEFRILHACLMTTFILLAYTGFALIYPEAWWVAPVRWISEAETFRSQLHRIAGVVMIVVSLYHAVVSVVTKRGRAELMQLWPRWKDVTDFRDNLLFLLGKRQRRPHFDRFGYVEKVEYWALVWGTIVMAVTGVILWFEDISLQFMPLWLYEVCGVVHRYEAILAVSAIIVWHLYHVLVNPDEAPMSTVWLDGKLTIEELKKLHPAEYDRLVAEGKIDPI